MNYHELEKTKVSDLRAMVKEKLPEVKGVSGIRKQELVDLLAEHLGIEKPHKVVAGVDKAAIKAEIRELKQEKDRAIEARDRGAVRRARKELHRLRRALRKATRVAG